MTGFAHFIHIGREGGSRHPFREPCASLIGVYALMAAPPPISPFEHQAILEAELSARHEASADQAFEQYQFECAQIDRALEILTDWSVAFDPRKHRGRSRELETRYHQEVMRWSRERERLHWASRQKYFDSMQRLANVVSRRMEFHDGSILVRRMLGSGTNEHLDVLALGIAFHVDEVERISPSLNVALEDHYVRLRVFLIELDDALTERNYTPYGLNHINHVAREDHSRDISELVQQVIGLHVAPLRTAISIRRANERFFAEAAALLEGPERTRFQRLADMSLLPGYASIAPLEDLLSRALEAGALTEEQRDTVETLQRETQVFWERLRPKAAEAHRNVMDIDKHMAFEQTQTDNVIHWARTGEELPLPPEMNIQRVMRSILNEIDTFAAAKRQALEAALGPRLWREIQ